MWRKRRHIPTTTKLVGISNWLSESARGSAILRGTDIRTIPNAIDCRSFSPLDKSIARSVLGLPLDEKILLLGAQNIGDFYKGFQEFFEAIKLAKSNFMVVFFGKSGAANFTHLHRAYRSVGFLHDEISLRLLYAAADIFVAPSKMEAFGKTIAESMACGTPVVAFDATGPAEIVDHQHNGYLAKPFDSVDMALGIDWTLNHHDPQTLAKNARQKVLDCYDIIKVARQYTDLYEQVLAKHAEMR